MNHAVVCVILRSRRSFIDDKPFKDVVSMYTPKIRLRSGRLEASITVPVLTLKYLRQRGQR